MLTWSSLSDKIWPSAQMAGEKAAYCLLVLILALAVLVVGLYVSRLVNSYAQKIFEKIRFDARCAKMGVNEVMRKFGLGKSPSYAVAFILSWIVVLISVYYAAQIMGLNDVQNLIHKFLLLIPTILVSFFILVAGLLLGKFVGRIISNSSEENDLPMGKALAQAANSLIVLFATLMALENLGINMSLINSLVIVILASMGLAFAIAFGLGAKPIAEEMLRNTFKKEKKE